MNEFCAERKWRIVARDPKGEGRSARGRARRDRSRTLTLASVSRDHRFVSTTSPSNPFAALNASCMMRAASDSSRANVETLNSSSPRPAPAPLFAESREGERSPRAPSWIPPVSCDMVWCLPWRANRARAAVDARRGVRPRTDDDAMKIN